MKRNIVINGIETWGPNELSHGGWRIHWSTEEGFGTITMYVDLDYRFVVDGETMDDAFIQEVLSMLIYYDQKEVRPYWVDEDGNIFTEDSEGNLIFHEEDEHEA